MVPHQLPADNADLVHVEVDFPRLSPDTPENCPASFRDFAEYLAIESPDAEDLRPEERKFCRTALVEGTRYWIWTFEEGDGTQCYVTISVGPFGGRCIGYDENHYGLSPEQYILGDYRNVF